MSKYTFNDMPDKSKEGIERELQDGLATAAVYFETTIGVPHEILNDYLTSKLGNRAEQLLWYISFRNQHSNLFKK